MPSSHQSHTLTLTGRFPGHGFLGGERRREKDDVQYLNPTAKSYLFAIDNKSILNDLIYSTWI
jgi:hypothetical protein